MRTQKKRVRTQEWLTTNPYRPTTDLQGWTTVKKGPTTLPQKNTWKSKIIVTHVGKEGVEIYTPGFVEKYDNGKIDQWSAIGL